MLEDDLKALRRAVEDLTRAINESTALLVSASLERAAESEQYELELDSTEVSARLVQLREEAAQEALDDAAADQVVQEYKEQCRAMSEPEFRALMMEMSRAGYKDELRAKLAEFNVEKAGDLNGKARESYIDWLVDLAERS